MKIKHIILVSLILTILAMGAVSASQDNVTDDSMAVSDIAEDPIEDTPVDEVIKETPEPTAGADADDFNVWITDETLDLYADGDKTVINFTSPDGEYGDVNIYVNDEANPTTYEELDEDTFGNVISIPLEELWEDIDDAGTYRIKVTFNPDEGDEFVIATGTITVTENFTPGDFDFEHDDHISSKDTDVFTLTEVPANGKLIMYVNGTECYTIGITGDEPEIYLKAADLKIYMNGRYNIRAEYNVSSTGQVIVLDDFNATADCMTVEINLPDTPVDLYAPNTSLGRVADDEYIKGTITAFIDDTRVFQEHFDGSENKLITYIEEYTLYEGFTLGNHTVKVEYFSRQNTITKQATVTFYAEPKITHYTPVITEGDNEYIGIEYWPESTGTLIVYNAEQDGSNWKKGSVFMTIPLNGEGTVKVPLKTLAKGYYGFFLNFTIGDFKVEKFADITVKERVDDGTFAALQKKINDAEDGSTITLEKDYTYSLLSDSGCIEIAKNITIDGNGHTIDAIKQARIFNIPAGTVVLKNIKFINGLETDLRGGAIYWTSANGAISNCEFINNTAETSGALEWRGENGTISDCVFTNNKATNAVGGAVTLSANNCSITGCTFEGNTANTHGGALRITGNDFSISGCNFINNKAGKYGGAIHISNFRASICECSFENNAGDNGGAICMNSDNTTISNCHFERNNGGTGGAIYIIDSMNAFISASEFVNNTSQTDSGAIYMEISKNASVMNSIFKYNKASTNAGALRLNTCNESRIVDCLFENNIAKKGSAGAIRIYESSDVSIFDSSFLNNQAVKGKNSNANGGAIYWEESSGRIFDSDFKNNNASDAGGAIYGAANTFYAFNCNFENNTAATGGAVYYGDLINCNFKDNHAEIGNAVYGGSIECCAINGSDIENANIIALNFTANNVTTTYNSGEKLTFNLTSSIDIPITNRNVKIDIYKNNTLVGTFNALTGDGWVIDLTPGVYTAVCNLTEIYGNDTAVNASIKINQSASKINAPSIVTTYNSNDNLVITVVNDQNNPAVGVIVTVDLNGVKNYTTDANGQIKIPVTGLAVGTHTANITFSGNDNYLGSNATANVTVNKAATTIVANAVTTTYDVNKNLVITLKDSLGRALSNTKVTVNLNGVKTYTTDKNGQIKINVGKFVPKTYTAKITFNGDANYLSSAKDVKVTVKKAASKIVAKKKTFKKAKKVKKYTITLKSGKKAIKKVQVTLKVKGKTYKAKTTAKGKATFKIKNLKKKGKFTATIKFKGNKYYNKATKKVKITIK